MFYWTKDSIDWYVRATQYTNHYKCVGTVLQNYLDKEDTVCDLGCGLGIVDAEIAPYVNQIDGFDLDEDAIDYYNRNAKEKQIMNIEGMVRDWNHIQHETYDVVFLCSFGSLRENLDGFMKIAKKKVIMTRRSKMSGENAFISHHSKPYVADLDIQYLEEQRIPYVHQSFVSEFGQPFADYEEAEKFLEHYHIDLEGNTIEQYIRKKAEAASDGIHKFYLPNKKNMEVIVIRKSDYLKSDGTETI